MNLGERIKSLREERGWTQEELAKKISIGQQYISKYESGKAFPSFKTLEKLADAFGVSVDFLRMKEKINFEGLHVSDPRFIELLNELDGLSEEDLLTIKNVIEAIVFRSKNSE